MNKLQPENGNSPDLIYFNGKIYTVNKEQPWVEAIAVSRTKISAVGDNNAIKALATDNTKLIDLEGAFVMPGIHDMHCHPDWALAAEFSYYHHWPAFPQSLAEMKENLLKLDKSTPQDDWIYAGPMNPFAFQQEGVPMDARWLDSFLPDRKIALIDAGHHTLMTNTLTFKLAGISLESLDPSNGFIFKHDDGEPTGLFQEGAQTLIKAIMPPVPVSDLMKMFGKGAKLLHAQGITSAKFLHLNTPRLAALRELDRRQQLNLKVEASISWKDDVVCVPDRWELLTGARFEYITDHIDTNSVKFYLDGIPPNRTTFEKEQFNMGPELPRIKGNQFKIDEVVAVHDHAHGREHNHEHVHEHTHEHGTCCLSGGFGVVNFTYQELCAMVLDMDRRNIRVVAHAIGDQAAHWYVSAVENARKVNGNNGPRHQIAHSNSILRKDIIRARDANMIVEFSPQMWWPSHITAALWKLYDKEKADRYWPFREAQDEGAHYCFGSDWPVHGLQWWNAIEAMVTRRNPTKDSGFDYSMGENMGLSIEEAINALTMGGAYAMNNEHRAGSIEAGKDADFIVLDQNLLDITNDKISATQVKLTVFEGKEVYKNPLYF